MKQLDFNIQAQCAPFFHGSAAVEKCAEHDEECLSEQVDELDGRRKDLGRRVVYQGTDCLAVNWIDAAHQMIPLAIL